MGGGYGAGILLEIFTVVAFVISLGICYAVVLTKNSTRDVDHQIPIFKALLYSLVWTPVVLIWIIMVLKMMD
jgi:hypothetical protein